ncbi:hypothetical protein [Streptomyces hilarionis]|uniref:hypothetical protein n=1 Tax=Streptomyces hilarionis TaxID=2839954 RepID=UPI00211A64AB|nr:hypothetical protein [Streptomyces hilarionis]MCQ9134757.1 hypothetical protein [Streptomyces hilarionis]
MTARSVAARRGRAVAATAVVTAMAGVALVPAATVAAGAPGGHALRMTLGAPSPGGPLVRGGATESMILTVTNSSDRAQPFAAWLPGTPDGPSPVPKDSVVFDVSAVHAPPTRSAVGRQDGLFQGRFFPAAGDAASSFSIPAKSAFTWKVTVGLGASYPTADGDFTLVADALLGDVGRDPAHSTAVLRTDPAIAPGRLTVAWEHKSGTVVRPGRRAELVLRTTFTGPGEFPAELTRTVAAHDFRRGGGDPDFVLEAEIDGRIVGVEETGNGQWELPAVAAGFGSASGPQSLKLYFSLGDRSDIAGDTVVPLEVLYSMGDSWGFGGAETRVTVGPARPTTSTTSPSAEPPTPASPTPTIPPSASAPVAATPSASGSGSGSAAAVTGGAAGGATDLPGANGTLAATGPGGPVRYGALAAVLLAVGGAAARSGRRRRTTAGG